LIECVEEEVVDDNKVEFVSDAFDDGVFDVEIWVDDAIGETCDDFPVDDVFIEWDAIDDTLVVDCKSLDGGENENSEYIIADDEEFTEYDIRIFDDDFKTVDVEAFFCSDVEIKSDTAFKLKVKEDS
jgi:hypothetical protein